MAFSFRGEWKGHKIFDSDGQVSNDPEDYSVEYTRDDLWLILDKDLKTIVRDEKGEKKQFSKGFIGNVDIKKEGKKKKYIYNIPLKFMVKGINLYDFNIICKKKYVIFNHGSQALDIATGKITKEYSRIIQISDTLFLYKDKETSMIGITNINDEIILGNCFLITLPVSKYIFVAKEKFDNLCCVYLYDIKKIQNPIALAINNISKEELVSFAERDGLEMDYNSRSIGLKSIELTASNRFEDDFVNKVSIKPTMGQNLTLHFSHRHFS